MIAWLLSLLGVDENVLNVATYTTVRGAGALLTAFVISVLLGERTINYLRRLKLGQHIRDDQGDDAISLKEMHAGKAGTPTMGGVLMAGSILCAILLFGDWSQQVLPVAAVMMIGFCAIGFTDDYLKVVRGNSDGLSPKAKLISQNALAFFFGVACVTILAHTTTYPHANVEGTSFIALPFFKDLTITLGFLYIPYAMLVLAATSNAVNLTDGLDGLAAGVTITATLCFGVVAFLAGHAELSSYLIIPHVRGAGELAVLLAALIGACFGFLWWNGYPARVFMGDTGSMMIGGLLGSVALLLKQEFLLLIAGGVFVAEALSVILQVGSYKLRKKRIFLMSPLHHHFERAGVPESHIIVRFWIVSALLALAGLSTLKLR